MVTITAHLFAVSMSYVITTFPFLSIESDEATVPHILLSPVNTTAVEGSTVQFQCASSGGSMPTWSPTPPTATVLTPSGVLQLNSVTNSNEGLYQCHVGNGTASALLTVEGVCVCVVVMACCECN